MNRPFRTVVTVLLLLAFTFSAAMTLFHSMESSRNARSNEEARQIAFSSSPSPDTSLPSIQEQQPATHPWESGPEPTEENDSISPLEALQNMDFSQLRKLNPDIFGWILIPDTQLSYPLVQGEDNQFYLDHSWKRDPSPAGSIFMECKCSRTLDDFNTILYGHRMRDGSMFATLKHYGNSEFWQAHPSVYLADENGLHSYDVFAAWEAGITEAPFRLQISDEGERLEFIRICVERSVIRTGIQPEADDRILTLSTCTGAGYDTRWVVQAVNSQR